MAGVKMIWYYYLQPDDMDGSKGRVHRVACNNMDDYCDFLKTSNLPVVTNRNSFWLTNGHVEVEQGIELHAVQVL